MATLLELQFDPAPRQLYSFHQEFAGAKLPVGCGDVVAGTAPPAPKCARTSLVKPPCCMHAASDTPQRTPNSNFLRGAKWSPDGACLLTAADDSW